MFQLIVAVISIALVAALAIASIYYGGTAFNQGTLKANVTTLVNAGQQISGAQALYVVTNGAGTTDIAYLADASGTYLSGPPAVSSVASGAWSLASEKLAVVALNPGTAAKVCDQVALQGGSSTGTDKQFYCSTANGSATGTAALAFKL